MKKRKKLDMPLSIKILLLLTGILVAASFIVPIVHPIDLGDTDLPNRLAKPSIFGLSDSGHLLGCDYLGRDLLIRLLYATRTTFVLAFLGLLSSAVLGTALGVIAGVFGGIWDDIIMFLVNVRHAVPAVLIGIIAATIFGSTEFTMVLLTTLIQWTKFARQARSQILQIRTESYIECSRAIGASPMRIIFEHVLRNIASPLIVTTTMTISSIILFESTLSYLALGIQPPNTSLGVMVAAGRDVMLLQWWQAIIPTALIVLIVMTASLTGDWLRDKLDPKLKKHS
ncbi:MAG: ABC transporter permease [Firmicutes bacterium]|nr:ABC transporter permease [Bacillota bacterium]MBQ4576559.1 ABC transporter permease [Bacillota bacterium]MBR2001472.1 ABC transporter permease [Bacillota bacterium]